MKTFKTTFLSLITGLALSAGFMSAATAAGKTATKLPEASCDKLEDVWWRLEDLLQQNGPCLGHNRAACLANRHDLYDAQITVEQAAFEGGCAWAQ